MIPPGTLYVVATPIGNLEDLTFRALRILREVSVIAAEDTRRTAKLLARYEVRKPLVSVREHNEARAGARLVEQMLEGQSVALVSDAGTPAIADPGARLVRLARERGLPIVPIPGPSAITAALSVSGLEQDEFVFMGFPPSGGTARGEWLTRLADEPRTAVFFEAPHRITRLMTEIDSISIKRPIYIFREISKIHEDLVVRQINQAVELADRGEFTVVVPPRPKDSPIEASAAELLNTYGRLTDQAGFDMATSLRVTAFLSGLPEPTVAKLIKKQKILVKQQNSASA